MSQSDQNIPKYARKPVWEAEKQELGRRYKSRADKLKADREADKRRQAYQRDFFRDPKVKLAAIVKALSGNVGRDTAYTLAANLNLYGPQEHLVSTRPHTKGDGGTRTICILPPELKAKHRMIKSALDAQLVRHHNLFGVKDHGRDKAAQYIQSLQQAGFTCLWQTDITDCFASFDLDALAGLPLPEKVKSNALDTRLDHFSFQALPSNSEAMKGASPETPNAATPEFCTVQDHRTIIGSSTEDIVCNTSGPRGLMQGSPASSAILAWYLNDILHGLPCHNDVQVIVCFDNLLIASRNEEDNHLRRITLSDSLGQCSFGPLTLHTPTPSDPFDGMDFLGYNHPIGGGDIGIGHKARQKLIKRLTALDDDFWKNRDCTPTYRYCYRLWSMLLDYASGFSCVRDKKSEMADFFHHSAWIPKASHDPALEIAHWHLFDTLNTADPQFLKSFLALSKRYGFAK
ncbi:RNA-dependent RNA polymerase family protein [Shimia gijangensis]|nr:hypothetical protein [Shimia gijangensis]